ncbi:MAG: hypothetical protein ACXVDD_24195 [Polyangia bacterium]
MRIQEIDTMQRSLVIAAAAAATLFTATAANAHRVDWSIGINVPPVATVVSSGPVYYPAPTYTTEPVYYAPPVYSVPEYYPPRVVYAPRPRLWLPPAPPLPWFVGHDRWHHDGGRDRDRGHDRHHDGRVDWRR